MDIEGKKYDELSLNYQHRIEDTQLTINILDATSMSYNEISSVTRNTLYKKLIDNQIFNLEEFNQYIIYNYGLILLLSK